VNRGFRMDAVHGYQPRTVGTLRIGYKDYMIPLYNTYLAFLLTIIDDFLIPLHRTTKVPRDLTSKLPETKSYQCELRHLEMSNHVRN
jgi:hypothetical protein